MGIFLRWLGAFVLLSATFNPTDINFIRWAEANWSSQMPLTTLLGLLLGLLLLHHGGGGDVEVTALKLQVRQQEGRVPGSAGRPCAASNRWASS